MTPKPTAVLASEDGASPARRPAITPARGPARDPRDLPHAETMDLV
jgi:hypothetical protein